MKRFLERKYGRLIEESYNLKYTEDSKSDVLAFEAIQLEQKLKFLNLA